MSLVSAVHSKDRLTRCFLELRDDLLRFLTRRTGRAAAEDIAQDLWLRLHERGDPDAWREPRAVLFTTAANLATDVIRHSAVVDKHASQEAPEPGAEVASSQSDLETQADSIALLERLHGALMELPQSCRDTFLLYRIEGQTHAQIAKALGLSTKTVQRYIERAMQHCLHSVDP